MRIGVVGTGYVGLVTGACLAEMGHRVVCMDRDVEKISRLRLGEIPIFEKDLEPMVRRGMAEGRLEFVSEFESLAAHADVIFLAVGTPSLPGGEVDLSFVDSAVDQLAEALKLQRSPRALVVVNKSTVPVGTQKRVAASLKKAEGWRISVVSNPEFLKEGSAVEDFMKPDRVVVGVSSDAEGDRAFDVMRELYAPLASAGVPLLRMDATSAELSKYACNAFLAARISFMNELSRLCEKVGADIEHVRGSMAADPRIGPYFLSAGFGYGGSCFPKDVTGLASLGKAFESPLSVVEAVHQANELQKIHVILQTIRALGNEVEGKTVALWGLAFKPGTDDIREAPALQLAQHLIAKGARVRAYDPVAMPVSRQVLGYLGEAIVFCESAEGALGGADVLVVATEWDEFRRFDPTVLRQRVSAVVDARNVFDPQKMTDLGFQFYAVGRGSSLVRNGRSLKSSVAENSAPDARAWAPVGDGRYGIERPQP